MQPSRTFPPAAGPFPVSATGRLAAGLLVSAAVHAAFIVAARLPRPASPAAAQPGTARLTLRLRPPPLPAAPAVPAVPSAPSAPSAPSVPRRAAVASPRPAPPAPAQAADNPAPAAAPAPSPTGSPIRPAAPDTTDLMAAARHDAAQFARELNAEASKESKRNGGAGQALRNTRQALLDRRFEEAFTAARGWNGALPMKEVTRASDGNTRVYVLSTPLGKVCMTTSVDTNPRLGDNPGQSTSYGFCTR